MPPSAKQAAKRWAEIQRQAERHYTVSVDAVETAKLAYLAGRMSTEEFEAEVGKLLAESGR